MLDPVEAGPWVYVRQQDVLLRDVAGESLLIPVRNNVAEMNAIFALAGIGPDVWQLLDGVRTLQAVCESIAESYDVSPDAAWRDLSDFVAQLADAGLIHRQD
jgi:hypothetical protein